MYFMINKSFLLKKKEKIIENHDFIQKMFLPLPTIQQL